MASGPDLRQDLDLALALIAKLRAEKEDGLLRLEQLRHAHLEQQEASAALREELRDALEGQRNAQEILEDRTVEWEGLLRAREREITRLHAETIPRDELGAVRQQISVEVQGRTEQQRQALTEEVERYREAYYDARGEAERLKATLDATTLDVAQREQRTEQHKADVQRMLEDKVHALQREADDDVSGEQARMLRLELTSCQMRIAALQQELDNARRDKLQAITAKELALQQATRAQSDIEGATVSFESEREGHATQLDRLRRELNERQDECSRLREECARNEQGRLSLRMALEDKIRQLQQALSDAHLKHTENAAAASEAMQDLEAEKALAQTRQAAAEAALTRAKEALQSKDLAHAEELHAAREAEWARVREAEDKALALEQALHQARTAAAAAAETQGARTKQLGEQLEEATLARDSEQREATRLRRDAETLRQKAGQLEQLLETHQDVQQQLARLSQDHETLRSRHEQLVREHERTSGVQASQERELLQSQAALRESKEQAAAGQQAEAERHARERKELEAALDALQEKFHQLSELAETSKVKARAQRRRLEDHIKAIEAETDAKTREIASLQENLNAFKRRWMTMQGQVRHFGKTLQEETLNRGADILKGPHAIPLSRETVDIEGRKVDLRDVYNRLQAWERSPEGAAASAAAAAE